MIIYSINKRISIFKDYYYNIKTYAYFNTFTTCIFIDNTYI